MPAMIRGRNIKGDPSLPVSCAIITYEDFFLFNSANEHESHYPLAKMVWFCCFYTKLALFFLLKAF